MATNAIVGAGAGGHARSLLELFDALGDRLVVGLVDPDAALHGTAVLGRPVLGGDEELERVFAAGVRAAFVGVGTVDGAGPRRRIFERLVELGFELPVLCHPSAIRARSAMLGAGTVVLAGAIVNAQAVIGRNVIVNTGAIVEHDCRIEDHVHLATGCRLGGGVTIETGCHVGIGATVIQGVSVGAGALVAAGAVVVRDVPPGSRVAGVPAVPMKERRP